MKKMKYLIVAMAAFLPKLVMADGGGGLFVLLLLTLLSGKKEIVPQLKNDIVAYEMTQQKSPLLEEQIKIAQTEFAAKNIEFNEKEYFEYVKSYEVQ